jgi:hypothetical protein
LIQSTGETDIITINEDMRSTHLNPTTNKTLLLPGYMTPHIYIINACRVAHAGVKKIKNPVCNIKYQINPLNFNSCTALHYQSSNNPNNYNPYAVQQHAGLYAY